jgi:hypothetical protein
MDYTKIDTIELLNICKNIDYDDKEYDIIRKELDTRSCPWGENEEEVYLSDGVSVSWITGYLMGL